MLNLLCWLASEFHSFVDLLLIWVALHWPKTFVALWGLGIFRTQKSFLQTNAWQHQNLNALRYNTSQAGSVIPWMDGTTRVAVNLIDFGNYRGPNGGGKKGKGVGPLPIGGTNSSGGFKGGGGGKGKGKGGKKGGNHFSVDVAFGVCAGPVTIAPASFVWSSAGVAGFSSVMLNAYSGADGQAADPVMAGLHPPPAIGYSGTCVITGTPMDLGMSPVIPNLSFEPAGPNAGTAGAQTPQDANPSKVVTRFLADPRDGADFPAANLAPDIDTVYGDYCLATGLVISPLLSGQTAAQEWLSGLAKLTNTAIVWSGNLLKLIPYGDMPVAGNGVVWTPDLIPKYSLTDDDFLPWHDADGSQLGQAEENQEDPILVTRSNPADAVNWLTIEYLDRSNFYNSTVTPVFDQGAIDTYGLRTGDNLNGHCFCLPGAAQVSAQLHLQRLQYIRNTYKFQLGWPFALLEPMDIVLLSGRCGDLYLDLQPVRITAIDENERGDLTIEAEEISVMLPTCAPPPPPPPPAPSGPILFAQSASNSAVVGPGNAASGSVSVSTTTANEVLVLHVDFDAKPVEPQPSVTRVDGGGFLWRKRAAVQGVGDNGHYYGSEVWWAIAPSPTTVTVTVTPSTGPAGMTMTVIGVSGVNTAAPWDANPALPAIAQSFTAPPVPTEVTGVSTSNPNTTVLFQYSQFDVFGAAASPTPGSFGLIPAIGVGLGNAYSFVLIEDTTWIEVNASRLNGVTLNTAGTFPTLSHWIIIADALQAA